MDQHHQRRDAEFQACTPMRRDRLSFSRDGGKNLLRQNIQRTKWTKIQPIAGITGDMDSLAPKMLKTNHLDQ